MSSTLDTGETRKNIWGLHPNVFFLGISSLLNDISSEMIFTLIPLFLANVLGATTEIIGLVGGLSDSADAGFRILGGWFSDKIKKRKLLAVLGYSLSTVIKPIMYFASSWGMVTGIRLSDRVGKGIRSAPRDALVADSVAEEKRGRGFGLHRAMDTAGAVIGLASAAVIIYIVQGGGFELSLKSYQWIVLVGIVPAVLAVLVLQIFVRERKSGESLQPGPRSGEASPGLKKGFDARFKIFLVILGVFTLGKSSDFFVILRAQKLEVPLIQVVMMLVLFNIVYSLSSLPMGILSDRLGRRRMLALGWGIYALVYLGFALATAVWQSWLLFAFWGVYFGVVEGVGRAFVADLVPEERRGLAYGLYHGVVGFAVLPASLIAGWLWDKFNPSAPFFFGAGLALLAMIAIMTLIKEPVSERR